MTEKKIEYQHYLTVTHQHYIPKEPFSTRYAKREPIYTNLITGDLEPYLKINEPLQEDFEDAKEYFDKTKAVKQKMFNVQDIKNIDLNYIKRRENNEELSTYMVDYAKIDCLKEYMDSKKHVYDFPVNQDIPESSQRYNYRNPSSIKPGVLEVEYMKTPKMELAISPEVLQIMNIRTGKTEYMATIGKLGKFVTEKQMHGKVCYMEDEK